MSSKKIPINSIQWLASLENLDKTQVINANTQKLLAYFSGDKIDIVKIKKIISAEPILSAKLLMICNSPFFGFPRKIENIEEAIVILGAKKLRMIVYTSILSHHPKNSIVTKYLRHSLFSAIYSREISKRTGESEDLGYITGLLQVLPVIVNYNKGIEHELTSEILRQSNIIIFDKLNFPTTITNPIDELFRGRNQLKQTKILRIAFDLSVLSTSKDTSAFRKILDISQDMNSLNLRPTEIIDLIDKTIEERHALFEITG